jgi:hypothetical protein
VATDNDDDEDEEEDDDRAQGVPTVSMWKVMELAPALWKSSTHFSGWDTIKWQSMNLNRTHTTHDTRHDHAQLSVWPCSGAAVWYDAVHVGVLAEGLDDGRADGQVRHKMPARHPEFLFFIYFKKEYLINKNK